MIQILYVNLNKLREHLLAFFLSLISCFFSFHGNGTVLSIAQVVFEVLRGCKAKNPM